MTPPRQLIPETPLYDAWVTRLRQELEPRGSKTELARHMSNGRNQPLHTWQVIIARILRADSLINAEDLLAITAWMDARADKRGYE